MRPNQNFSLTPVAVSYVVVILLAAGLGVLIAANGQRGIEEALFGEHGVLESLTLGFYSVAAILAWRLKSLPVSVRIALIGMCVAFILRELDFDTRFTEIGVLRTSYYFSSEYPLQHRIVAAISVGAAIACLVYVLLIYGKAFTHALLRRHPAAILIALGVVFMPIAKSFDGKTREWMERLGLADVPPYYGAVFQAAEETFETLAPVSFILAAIAFMRMHNQRYARPSAANRPSDDEQRRHDQTAG